MFTQSHPPARRRLGALLDAFAWPLRASHYAELLNPLWASHRLQARIERVRDETADARTLTLKPGAGWRGHRPGQHLRIGVPIGGRLYTRTYSIASAPERDDRCIEITVKAVAEGRASRYLVRHARAGDVLPIGLPQGEFCLPDATPVRPLFITAGSGITPVMGMLRSLVARERLPDAVHVHYAPRARDAIFGDELRALAARHPRYRLHLVGTRDEAPAGGARHFAAAPLEALAPDWRQRDAYACGPQALLDAVEAHWRGAGLARRLQTERFRAPLARLDAGARGGTVRFAAAGVTVQGDAATPLLRVAEDAGLNPAHGCRMGICHTCPRVLRAGSVRDLRTGQVHGEPGDKVLICVNAAAGDCELEL